MRKESLNSEVNQQKLPNRDAENEDGVNRAARPGLWDDRQKCHTHRWKPRRGAGGAADTSETVITENVPESVSGTKPQVQEGSKAR